MHGHYPLGRGLSPYSFQFMLRSCGDPHSFDCCAGIRIHVKRGIPQLASSGGAERMHDRLDTQVSRKRVFDFRAGADAHATAALRAPIVSMTFSF